MHQDPVLRALCADHPPWWQASLIAQRQGRAIAVAHLRDCAIKPRSLRTALQAGTLHKCHRGVRIFGAQRLDEYGRRWAAYLAAGEDTAFTRDTGAALTGLPVQVERQLHLVAPKKRRDHKGVTVHLAADLDPSWIWRRNGLPVLKPPHLLLDLAPTIVPDALGIVLNEALAMRLVTLDRLAGVLTTRRRHPGASSLEAAVAAAVNDPGEGRTHRELEALVLGLLRKVPDLPPYVRNDLVELAGGRMVKADIHFRDLGVLVELDSRTWHEQRLAMDSDRRKDQQALACGRVIFRITWRHATDDWDAVLVDLVALLAERRR